MKQTTTTTTLWRVALTADQPVARPDQLVLGLRRHLAVASLRAAVVQIGERQQAYIALDGCSGCAHGRCVEGCRVEALRRTLRAACGSSVALSLVKTGLSPRPYTRRYVLRPMAARSEDVVPLSGAYLRAWPEARLTVAWNAAQKGVPSCAVTLHLGELGPEPSHELAALGWQTISRPFLMFPRREQADPHLGLELGTRLRPDSLFGTAAPWSGDPWLPMPTQRIDARAEQAAQEETLAPASVVTDWARYSVRAAAPFAPALTPVEAAPAAAETPQAPPVVGGEGSDEEDAINGASPVDEVRARRMRLALHLRPMAAGETVFSGRGVMHAEGEAAQAASSGQPASAGAEQVAGEGAAQPEPAKVAWPKGPGSGKECLYPNVLEDVFTVLLADDGPYRTGEGGPGLRYAHVLDALGEKRAGIGKTLMVWIDKAGLFGPPENPDQPWQKPRLLTTLDLGEIAAKLAATEHPTDGDMARGTKGLKK